MLNFNKFFLATLGLGLLISQAAHAQLGVGYGATAPRTMLDVNGAVALAETSVAVASNAATIPTGYSQVQLTGTATATIALTSAATPAPVPGQRVTIYNTTTRDATFNSQNIPAGQSVLFVYSNGGFRATGGGGNALTADNGLNKNTGSNVRLGGNLITATTVTNNGNTLSIAGSGSTTTFDAAGNVGIGTAPLVNLHVLNKGAGGTGVFSTNTTNMALRLDASSNAQSVIQYFTAKNTAGTTKEFLLGINPTFNSEKGIFYIGRTGSNDVAIDLTNGYVGIGTGAPISPLSVTGTANVTDRASFGNGVNIQGIGQSAMTITSTNSAIAGTPIAANTAGNFYYDASGRETHVFGGDIAPDATNGRDLGLSTARWSTLYVTSINNTNAPSNSSDIRLKKDIKPTTYGLQEVLRMRPVSYRWKQDLDNVGVMLGFIAQEMDTIIPESVTKPKTDKDFYGIRYTELIPVLTKAIQEQQTEIDALKAANAQLASDNTALKAGFDSKASASTVNELQAVLQALRAEIQTMKPSGSTASAK